MRQKQKSTKTLAEEIDDLLVLLCVERGYCNHLRARDLVGENGAISPQDFARAVLVAEGFNPELESRRIRDIAAWFAERYLPPAARGSIIIRDVTDAFRSAAARGVAWNPDVMSDRLSALAAEIPGASADFEPGAEGCGTLLEGKSPIGFIHGRLPLGFFREDYSRFLDKSAQLDGVERVMFSSWEGSLFSVDQDVAEAALKFPLPSSMDPRALYVSDLWYWFVSS